MKNGNHCKALRNRKILQMEYDEDYDGEETYSLS
jgi:hypothetical protein